MAALERGRAAYDDRRWPEAVALLGPLVDADDAGAADIERVAVAAYLTGDDALSDRAWERAHARFHATGDAAGAGRCAFWFGLLAVIRGSTALGNGWLARAERAATDLPGDHPLHGLLLMVKAWFATVESDPAAALELARSAEAIGEASGDADLLALAHLTHGEALVAMGEGRSGTALLDEAMVAVAAGEVSPVATGIVYCAVIDACMVAMDLRRAHQWTEALHQWCGAQPGLVPYRGVCLVHRSQILQAHGAWHAAEDEVERARQHLSQPPHPALGAALYQRAELHRVRGEHDLADHHYREATAHGFHPQPGLALLRLAQDRADDAVNLVRRMLREADGSGPAPAAVLGAAATVFLAADDRGAASQAADELERLAVDAAGDVVKAMAAHARGAVLLASDDATGALVALRQAARIWTDEQLPHEAAQTSTLIAEACRQLGDEDGAALELDAAAAAMQRLVAGRPRPTAAHAAEAEARDAAVPRGAGPDGLSRRECEVLRHVAGGSTNKEIGAALSISEHTVARHLQNIFAKTGLRSRAAAASYAHRHGIVTARRGSGGDGQD